MSQFILTVVWDHSLGPQFGTTVWAHTDDQHFSNSGCKNQIAL